jgi:tRNA pseudouridine55 synthase
MQIPPKFSAIKIDGQRAYDLARAGEDVVMKERPAYIENLEIIDAENDHVRLRCTCGKGTYMRSLARDIAVALGTKGHIMDLKRERVGSMLADNAISLEFLEEIDQSAALKEALLPVETMLDDIPALALKEDEANRLRQGQALLFIARPDVDRLRQAGIDLKSETTALALWQNEAIALVTCKSAEIKPLRLLNVKNA